MSVGPLRRCEMEHEARGIAGGGGKSARCDEVTRRARGPEQGDNAEKGSGNGSRDDGPVGALRGAIADENETAGGVEG